MFNGADQITTGAALRATGLTPGQIDAHLESRRWRRWGHAIALHNGPLTLEQRWEVARAHGGPRALLTAFTAAQAVGLRTWERDEVHVLVPRGTSVLRPCPVPTRIHFVRDWSRVRHEGPSAQHRADALLVACANLRPARHACGLLTAAVQQRIVTPDELHFALDRAVRTRYRPVLRAVLGDIEQGSDSLSEIDFVRLCRRFGLPVPVQQERRLDSAGRPRYLDVTLRRQDGRLIIIEVDGALHLTQKRWWADQERQNDLVVGDDALILRFPSAVIRTEPERVAAQIRRALQVRPGSGDPEVTRTRTKAGWAGG